MKCALCLIENELCDSHIIPEFFYKPLYDEKHRMNIIPLSSEQRKKYEQKGIREKLLCQRCEGQISKYESYARKVFFGGTELIYYQGNPITILNINYTYFKLFQLSLLWRASVSQHIFFNQVSLGPHENRIREMIYYEKPGVHMEYPCAIMGIFRTEQKELLDDLVMPPDLVRHDGHRIYRFVLGGCFWFFFVSSHTFSIPLNEFILNQEGIIRIPLRNFAGTDYCMGLVHDYQQHNK